MRRTNSYIKKCGSFDVDDSTTNHTVFLLQKIFLKQREEEESDFTKFYHFCFLACLRGKTEDVNAISVHDACELWAFLLSSTKKQLRKSSSLSVEEGSAPARCDNRCKDKAIVSFSQRNAFTGVDESHIQ